MADTLEMTAPAEGSVLDRRTLNRTLLARQLLLQRRAMPVLEAVEHLVGMQSQVPKDPYIGLWSRLEGFDPNELSRLMLERKAVRMTLLRTTLHLVSAGDAVALRPVAQSAIEHWFTASQFGRNVARLDRDELRAAGRELLAEPRSIAELGRLLAERWPERDPTSLGYAIAVLLPVVQVPPRGVWGKAAAPKLAPLDDWIGRKIPDRSPPDDAIHRYLRAFGPATIADFSAWSRLTGIREVIGRLRSQLRSYRDESGRELLDVEDGTFASGDSPAPPRFLGQFDNAVLSHKDRTRILGNHSFAELGWQCPVLVDGFLQGTWRLRTQRKGAVLTLRFDSGVARRTRTEAEAEGERLLHFLTPDATTRALKVLREPPP